MTNNPTKPPMTQKRSWLQLVSLREQLELSTPIWERGIGKVILASDSKDLAYAFSHSPV
jgi:hypothetical protein